MNVTVVIGKAASSPPLELRLSSSQTSIPNFEPCREFSSQNIWAVRAIELILIYSASFQLIFHHGPWLRLVSSLLYSLSDLYCDIIQKVSVCLHRVDLNIRMNTFCVYSWHWKNLVPVCSVLSNIQFTTIKQWITFKNHFVLQL